MQQRAELGFIDCCVAYCYFASYQQRALLKIAVAYFEAASGPDGAIYISTVRPIVRAAGVDAVVNDN